MGIVYRGGNGYIPVLVGAADGGRRGGFGNGGDVLQGNVLLGTVPFFGSKHKVFKLLYGSRDPVFGIHGNGKSRTAGFKLCPRSGIFQSVCNGHVHLSYRKIMLYGLLPVHRDLQGGGKAFGTIVYIHQTLYLRKRLCDNGSAFAQGGKIAGKDVYGDAVPGEHGTVHGSHAGNGAFRPVGKGLQSLSQISGNIVAVAAAVRIQQGINGQVAVPAGNAQSHGSGHAAAQHGAYISQTGNGVDGREDLVRQCAFICKLHILRKRGRNGDLTAVAVGEVGKAFA